MLSFRKRVLTEMQNIEKKKLSLFSAAIALADLCDKIDNVDELDDALLKEFDEASTSLEESIDRRKFVLREAQSKIELARAYKKSLDDTIKRLSKVQERIEKTTMELISSKPDLPFKDSFGNKVSIRKNSQPSLTFTLNLRDSKVVSNILDESSISVLNIDSKYLKTVSYTTLDTEKLKLDLQTGVAIEWASLVWGSHVRGLK